MRTWVSTRPVVAFYTLTLALSWGYWLTLLSLGQRVEPGSTASHFPGLLGPLISSLVATSVIGGRPGVLAFVGRMLRVGPNGWWNLLLALLPLALGAVAFVTLPALGEPLPPLRAFADFPGLPHDWPLTVIVLVVLVVNGFGEEAGWRGFLTEQLLPRYGPFKATVLVALLWALWHAPLFWLNASMVALVGPVLLGWVLSLVCGAFVLAQVYLVSGRSILWVAVWHAAYNMMVAPTAGEGLPAAAVSTLVMGWGLVVAVRWWRCPPEPPALVPASEPSSSGRRPPLAAHVRRDTG